MSNQGYKELLERINALEKQVSVNSEVINKNKKALIALLEDVSKQLEKMSRYFAGILMKGDMK